MTRTWAMCILLLLSNVSYAQHRYTRSQPLRTYSGIAPAKSNFILSQDTVRILAIMVEFKKDDFDQTTGDGTFLVSGSSEQIDPPPHDSLYFQNKIQFVKNYFNRVSNGKLAITGNVYGKNRRITLSKPMKFYSPPTITTNNKELADLAKESWQIADSLYPEIDFSQYDAFVIFHAGVGRDIELVPDYTPFDIPSLYLDSTAFTAALGQSSFSGFGRGSIKNTIILPETESRNIPGNTGPDTLLQLSINGLFAASVGSYLGLPDLFNTKTGSSGIGQFGLMDGADIFSFSGLFPPEPSAWEKIYLGWLTPISIGNSTINLSVPAVGLKYPMQQDTVYKIPITSSEYFLVENRNRNPKGTGVDLKIANAHGDIFWRHFDHDTTTFNNYNDSLVTGSVVDVSNFDWALLGSTDSLPFYGGGIIIWHIDESVIQAGLTSNSVNTNPNHRGVDLEEADGSKDIGLSAPGSGPENGSPLDCWFAENNSTFYKNIFDDLSFPNSKSFSGAASLVTMKNFSVRSPRMTLTVEFGNPVLQRDSLMHRAFKYTSVNSFPTSTKNHLYLPTSTGMYALQNNGQSLLGNTTDLLSSMTITNGVAVYGLPNSTELVVGTRDSVLQILKISFNGHSSVDSVSKTSTHRFTTSPSIAKLGYAQLDSLSVLVGAESGTLYQFNTNGDTISRRLVGPDPVSSITVLPTSSSAKPNEYYFTSGNRMYGENSSVDLPVSSNSWMLAAAVSAKGNYVVAAEKNGNKLTAYNQSLSQKIFEINIVGSGILELAVADIDGDGEKDVIVQSTNSLSVMSRNGSMLDGFPVQARAGLEFTGTPLVIDFRGDAKQEIALVTNDGEMWMYDRTGKLLSGFPVQVAAAGKAYPMAYTSPSNKLSIAVISGNGSFDAFLTLSSVTSASFTWWQHLGNERHSNADASIASLSIPQSTEFFPKSRVYNWPNPVYGPSTQIRYFTSEDANVTITILDLSGKKITELSGHGLAGMDNEVPWNVSNIQSGVYLARVEAHGASRSDVVIIKIAVVK